MNPKRSHQDSFNDGMIAVGIEEAGMNHVKGSLYDFDCVTVSRLSQATHVLTIPFEFNSTNHNAQSLHFVEHWNSQTLSSGMQPMK